MPKSANHALELDKNNGNTFWQDYIAKKMKNVRVAFQIFYENEEVPIGYKFIRCCMIFDVKIEDFRRKSRLVDGGHMTDTPEAITYASIASCESVRLALMLAALNALKVKCGDVTNAYITAPITEKVWAILVPEFGADQGKKALIVRALYGIKSAGAALRTHLYICTKVLGYTPCLADPDLWYKSEVIPDDGFEYYSCIFCYVDYILVIHHDSLSVLKRIDSCFKLKPDSIGDPDIYLGAKVKKMNLANGTWCWTLSPSKYRVSHYV